MKYSHGFTKIGPTIFTVISLALSMYLLARVVDVIPLGTAYGIWVGIGALGAAIAGIILFQEEASPLRLIFLGLLLISLIGLKVSSK
jgi:quaternary ammonium compound-resistance protein SugE